MKEILIKLLSLTLLSYAGEMLLPEGNMKKYSNLLLSIVLCAALISSFSGTGYNSSLITEITADEVSEKYYGDVMAEYKKRAEAEIEKRCGAKATVETDENYNITHVKFFSAPDNTDFLKNDLGVSDSEIEFSDK